jgi:hypothetical protein
MKVLASSALMRHSIACPAELDVLLREGQLLAGGHQQLRLHQVDAGDQFGDRMLHLDARVHLDEVELAVLVEELERAGAAIAHRAAGLHDALAHLRADLVRDARRGRLLDDLLVAALHRAVALAQVDHVAVVVGHHLEFDVPRLLEEFLHVDLSVAEGRARFLLRHVDGVEQRGLGMHHAHAAAAAAARGLDDHRVADLLGDAPVLVVVLARAVRRSRARRARRPSSSR